MTDSNLMAENNMLAVGSIPIHPGIQDFADAKGKIILYVKDEEEGRSLYLSFEMYGELSRAYEVRYDDFEQVVTKMIGQVGMANSEDPFMTLLESGG